MLDTSQHGYLGGYGAAGFVDTGQLLGDGRRMALHAYLDAL